MDNRDKIAKFIHKHSFITLDEARKLGMTAMALSRLVQSEDVYRIERGVYAQDLAWLTDPLKKYIVACALYPEAIICGVSALSYYDLTDEEERQTWIALPAPKIIHNPRYHVIRPSGLAYTLGIETHTFGKRVVRLYDREKTVVDAFKYHTEEVAFKALKRYLKRKDKNIRKLCDYGQRLRKPLDEIITVISADD